MPSKTAKTGVKPKHVSRRKAAKIKREAMQNDPVYILKKEKQMLNKQGLIKDDDGNVTICLKKRKKNYIYKSDP